MAESIYQCEVNKAHTKKIPGGKRIAQYYCCGKPMTRIQAPITAAAVPKPQCQGLTQSSVPGNKPQQMPEQPSQQSPAV
jgi:hypothetical protein